MNVKQLFSAGSLPYELAIYVIFDLQYSKVHVVSRDVNSKYGIVKNQLEDPDNMTEQEVKFLKNLTTERQWRGGEDYSEFFDGAPPVDIMNQITRSRLRAGSISVHHVTPYNCLDVDEEYCRNLIPMVKEVKENHAGITYNNSSCLSVYIPRNVPPRFLMTKILLLGYISEMVLSNNSILYEKEVSRFLLPEWREVICNNALDIIKAALGPPYGIDGDTLSLLLFLQVESWSKVMHQHLTIN